jgi:hypothetical protein
MHDQPILRLKQPLIVASSCICALMVANCAAVVIIVSWPSRHMKLDPR